MCLWMLLLGRSVDSSNIASFTGLMKPIGVRAAKVAAWAGKCFPIGRQSEPHSRLHFEHHHLRHNKPKIPPKEIAGILAEILKRPKGPC